MYLPLHFIRILFTIWLAPQQCTPPFTTASTAFSKEAIKTAASPHFQCKPLVGAADSTKCAPSLGAISAGATIAIGSCDPRLLSKTKLDEALAASVEAIVVEAASGVDKDGAALDVTKYAVDIAGEATTASSMVYDLRDDVATPHDAIAPAFDGVAKGIARCSETSTARRRLVVGATLTKAEAVAAYSSVVAEVVTKAARSNSVTEDNIEDAMEAITSDAAAKTAYFVDEFDGVEVADLAAFSQATSEAVASKVMEMDSKSKVKSMTKMKKIHTACGMGGAKGTGKNKYLKTSGGLLSGAISKWSKGCSKGINKGSRKAKHLGFSGTSKKNKAKWMQKFSAAAGGGCVKGALGINIPNYGTTDLEDTYVT